MYIYDTYQLYLPCMSVFGELLRGLISAKYDSYLAFLRAAEGPEVKEGAQGYVSRTISGDVPPPMHRIPAWADALDLEGDERQRFLDLAAIACMPADCQDRFVGYITLLRSANARLQDIQGSMQRSQLHADRVSENAEGDS